MLPARQSAVSPRVELNYDRTISRLLVNRRAISEVFLTDVRPVDGTSFVCAAQLPPYHAYYSDHLTRPAGHDLLLLLECCRQAGTYVEYNRQNSPVDTANIVREFEIEIVDPPVLDVGKQPGELTLEVTTNSVRTGNKWQGTSQTSMFLRNRYIGHASIPFTTVTQKTFSALRLRQRGSEPPSTSNLPEAPTGFPVEPCLVGREQPANVLLTDAVVEPFGTTSRLGLVPRNRSILDHEYDHYPAMSLVEAARQAGLLTLGSIAKSPFIAAQVQATALWATFERFAELDEPVTVRARLLSGSPELYEPVTAGVECRQDDRTVAKARITYWPSLKGRS